MGRSVWIVALILGLVFGWQVNMIQADVVIKVRALNPLDTKEMAVINYQLPSEISEGDILSQKINYSMDHSGDEEPPKSDFQISLDKKTGRYFIDDEVILLPKEVVTLEVRVKDVWVIEKTEIEELYREVNGLLEAWEEQNGEPSEAESVEDDGKEEDAREFALKMKGKILDGLNKVMEYQDQNTILNVGAERHILAYEKNVEELHQIQQDIILLANLIQFDDEGASEQPESQEPILGESREIEEDKTVGNGYDFEELLNAR